MSRCGYYKTCSFRPDIGRALLFQYDVLKVLSGAQAAK